MDLRKYNIYFHTHTISGIIITAILFVIFFAGSFSFFKKEISNWQANSPNDVAAKRALDYNRILDSVGKKYDLYGREISFRINQYSNKMSVFVSESKDTINNKAAGAFFYLDTKSFATADYKASYDLGEFLYRLHFLAPVNDIADVGFALGYYIAGTVAFIFLFALITGLLVHWKKIVSNFYLFRPWEKLKTIWTDLHTGLGLICFPFLFIFAVTGAYFLIGFTLFTQPTVALQYGGNEDSLFADMGYGEHEVIFRNSRLSKKADLNYFVDDAMAKWKNVDISSIEAVDYGDAGMQVHVGGAAKPSEKFISRGELVYDVASGKVLNHVDPMATSSYSDVMENAVYLLHFGAFGGFATKILYFLLGICSCVVIISGILIWQVARDRKGIPERNRKFNNWLTTIYMAVCMSMFPVTAASFIAVKLYPNGGMHFMYSFYFWSWLLATIALAIRRDLYKISRDSILAGSLIGLGIPLVNGVISGNWIWKSYRLHHHDILLIDCFWLLLAGGAFTCYLLMVRKHKRKSKEALSVRLRA